MFGCGISRGLKGGNGYISGVVQPLNSFLGQIFFQGQHVLHSKRGSYFSVVVKAKDRKLLRVTDIYVMAMCQQLLLKN